jgi:hypothetical protein
MRDGGRLHLRQGADLDVPYGGSLVCGSNRRWLPSRRYSPAACQAALNMREGSDAAEANFSAISSIGMSVLASHAVARMRRRRRNGRRDGPARMA